MKNYRLGIIGCGNMSKSIMRQIDEGKLNNFLDLNNSELNLIVSDVSSDQLNSMTKFNNINLIKTTDNKVLIDNSDYIILAIKPQSSRELFLKNDFQDKTIISIMAGIKIDTILSLSNAKKIVRVMPNLNARIGQSYNAFCFVNLDDADRAFVIALLTCFGIAEEVDEPMINAVTGLAGSGPAFIFMFIKSFIMTAKKYGFSEEKAKEIALATIKGSADNIMETESDKIDDLVNSVCSKGGTTIEGVSYLKEQNFEIIVSNAIEKAIIRAGELAKDI